MFLQMGYEQPLSTLAPLEERVSDNAVRIAAQLLPGSETPSGSRLDGAGIHPAENMLSGLLLRQDLV